MGENGEAGGDVSPEGCLARALGGLPGGGGGGGGGEGGGG